MMGSNNSRMAKKTILVLSFILFFGGISLHPQTKKDPITIADNLMYLLNYEEAILHYKKAIENNPTIKGIRLSLGYAHWKLGDYDETIKILKEEIDLFPENFEAYILLGLVYFKQNKFEDAAKVCKAYEKRFQSYIREKAFRKGFRFSLQVRDTRLRSILKEIRMENPNIGLPNFILGLCQKRKGKLSEAKYHFRLALEWGYNPIDCYLQLIDLEIIKGEWRNALKEAQEVLRIKGHHPDLYFIMGYIHYQLKDIENALLCFEKALNMKPYLVEAMRNLSIIYYNQQRFEESSQLYERFLRISFYDVYEKYDLKYSLKNARVNKSLIDKMELNYIYPLKSSVHFSLTNINETALSLVKSGYLKKAAGFLHNCLEIDDTSPEINYNLGQLYNISNRLDKALKYALQAIELNPNFKDAHDLVGNIYFKIHDYERSIQSYKNVITIDSKDAIGYYNLGCTYYVKKNYLEAESHWKESIHYDKGKKKIRKSDEISKDDLSISLTVIKKPVSFSAHKSLASLYLEKNLLDKALLHFERAIELEPGDPEPYYESGKILQVQPEGDEKHIEKAIFYYEKYLYLGGQKEEEVNKRLKTLRKKSN